MSRMPRPTAHPEVVHGKPRLYRVALPKMSGRDKPRLERKDSMHAANNGRSMLVRPKFPVCRIPFLPSGLMALGQNHQRFASFLTRFVAYKLGFFPLLGS